MEANETTITIQRKRNFFGSLLRMKVWVDGKSTAKAIWGGQKMQITVPHGEHTLLAGIDPFDVDNVAKFTAEGEEMLFVARPVGMVMPIRFFLQQPALEAPEIRTVADMAKKYDITDGAVNKEALAMKLERDIVGIEEEMRSLKTQIYEASKAKDEALVSESRDTLESKYIELKLIVQVLKKHTGQRHKCAVSPWSRRRNRSSIVGLLIMALAASAIGTTLASIIGGGVYGMLAAALCFGGGLALGQKYGHLIPVHLIPAYNVKKTNLFLTVILTLVFGVGLLYSIGLAAPFLQDQLFKGHTVFLIVWLVISFSLSFFAIRYRVKVLLIVLSIIVGLAYINFVLFLAARIWLIQFLIGLFLPAAYF